MTSDPVILLPAQRRAQGEQVSASTTAITIVPRDNKPDTGETQKFRFSIPLEDRTDPTFSMFVVLEYAKDVPGASDGDLAWEAQGYAVFTGDPDIVTKDRFGDAGNLSMKCALEQLIGARVRIRFLPNRASAIGVSALGTG